MVLIEPEQFSISIPVDSVEQVAAIFGSFDENANVLRNQLGVTLFSREGEIKITGPETECRQAGQVVDKLLGMFRRSEPIDISRIHYAVELAKEGNADAIDSIMHDVIAITTRGRQIRCKTLGQKQYVEAIRKNTVCIAIGPAGTGKTYLAMAMAVAAFKNKEIERIILTRPAVEAGEKLGFLPGDLQNKVNPYLRPLYDALFDMMGGESYNKLQERGIIEVAPLAYMRGRTLQDSFIILDEAQNTTSEQMKMFLTRFGANSKVIINGDVTQIDLPMGKRSGLKEASEVLKNIEGIGIVTLTHRDVVRHELVKQIVRAYDRYERRREL